MAKALIAAITQMYFLMEILRVFCVTSRQLSKMFIQPLPDLKESFMKRIVTALLMASVVVAAPLAAHHGRGATYAKTDLSLKGTVKEVLWRNPHIAIFLDVKDKDGKVTTWAIEHSNISQLARLGYSRTTLRAGMEVTAVVNPGAKGEPIGLCQKIILADGKEIFLRDSLPEELQRGPRGVGKID